MKIPCPKHDPKSLLLKPHGMKHMQRLHSVLLDNIPTLGIESE